MLKLPDLGCGAVAIGQIMAFHEHPKNLSWTWSAIKAPGVPVALQNFLYNLAVDIQTNFATGGSNANNIITALKSNKYGYSSTASLVQHNSSTVRSQLNLNQPVLMQGTDPRPSPWGGTHGWVCTGYREHGYYTEYLLRVPTTSNAYATIDSYQGGHGSFYYYWMNWGYGGLGDAWYLSENVNMWNGNFYDQRWNIINIKKP